MPWNKGCLGYPDHYELPRVLSDDTVLGRNIEYAKHQRKKVGQFREGLLAFQKVCGQQKDIETARYFREEASELMKQFRGWDLAIAWIEGREPMNTWRHVGASESIASYIDQAFEEMDLCE